MSHQLIATCAFGLEAVVKRELQNLEFDARVVQPGWVSFQGDESAIALTNLALRTADRVLIEVAEFAAPDFDALFETTRELNWADWIPSTGSFPVKGRSIHSQLSSVPACQRSVKRAIVESLKRDHAVETLPEDGPTYQVEVAIRNDLARLTIDTTGPSLHKRGYRTKTAAAPLKETLAAAMVLLSVWNPDRPLIDPFCGSGTIPIEAALIGHNVAPGISRTFASEKWDSFPASTWQNVREQLAANARPENSALAERIVGTDKDAEVLELARFHARKAGVENSIHFQQQAFEDLRSKKDYGCVITNPPYGERLVERDMTNLYQSIPKILQRLPTWSHFILTAFPRFEAVIQKSATRRRKLYNGRIECMYYQYLGPKPPKKASNQTEQEVESDTAITTDVAPTEHAPKATVSSPSNNTPSKKEEPGSNPSPVFGGMSAKSLEQSTIFANRLKKRARHLRRWPQRGITCFRLYEKDIPEVPLVVDRYEDNLHIVELERPHDHDIAEHASWQDLMCKTAAQTLDIDIKNVYFKSKSRQRKKTQHEKVGTSKSEIMVEEGGLKFLVNLSDYVDTGLFLDHRVTRDRFRSESNDKRVLNLFGYTGAFSVYAADGGATSVLHVDSSTTYVEWAQKNMSINRFHGPQYVFQVKDVHQFFEGLPETPQFDLAIVDPPTFSNSKQIDQTWDVQRDHAALLKSIRCRMSDGGVIYFSTNFRRFKLDDDLSNDFAQFREITQQTLPEDFRNRRIHRCWRAVV